MLPGQAAAPDGPIDLTPMFVMHFAFRRDLRAFPAAVEATPVSDRRAWRALQRRWERFALVLHSHHCGEDAVLWPMLLERSSAAGDRDAVETLEVVGSVVGPVVVIASSWSSCSGGSCSVPGRWRPGIGRGLVPTGSPDPKPRLTKAPQRRWQQLPTPPDRRRR